MNNYEILISVFVEKLRSGVLTMDLVKEIYKDAPEGMLEQVINAIETRMEVERLQEARLAS